MTQENVSDFKKSTFREMLEAEAIVGGWKRKFFESVSL